MWIKQNRRSMQDIDKILKMREIKKINESVHFHFPRESNSIVKNDGKQKKTR